jgi:hypothetical protein
LLVDASNVELGHLRRARRFDQATPARPTKPIASEDSVDGSSNDVATFLVKAT